jgi:hypothetical protein
MAFLLIHQEATSAAKGQNGNARSGATQRAMGQHPKSHPHADLRSIYDRINVRVALDYTFPSQPLGMGDEKLYWYFCPIDVT